MTAPWTIWLDYRLTSARRRASKSMRALARVSSRSRPSSAGPKAHPGGSPRRRPRNRRAFAPDRVQPRKSGRSNVPTLDKIQGTTAARAHPQPTPPTKDRVQPGDEHEPIEQAIDSDDVHRHVLKFLNGKACRTASEAVVRWRKLQNGGWWRAKASEDLGVGFWPAEDEEDWLEVYKRCHRPPSLLKWVARPLRSHCLGDRVADAARCSPRQKVKDCTTTGLDEDRAHDRSALYVRVKFVSCVAVRVRKPVFKASAPRPGRPIGDGAQTLTPLWLTGDLVSRRRAMRRN